MTDLTDKIAEAIWQNIDGDNDMGYVNSWTGTIDVRDVDMKRVAEAVVSVVTAHTSMSIPAVWEHISHRWPTSDPFTQCAKVAEEAGEVIGAAIKEREGRRTIDDVLDELADTIIASIGAIQARGCNPTRVVQDRWAEVSQR